ncbi:MAG: metal ABC transporter permease [Clostridia bacterium]|nr:metal ABC transporter permease [Clostridia bacterium]
MDLIRPFLEYEFMRNALFAVLLIMPLFSLLGTMVVNNGMSFFSDALGHSALTGVGIGVMLGFGSYDLPMIAFAVVFALLMNRVRHSTLSSADTVIGVFSSCGVALGLVLLSRGGNFQNYQSLLIGDILNITPDRLWMLFFTLLAVVAVWLLAFNRFLAVSISPTLAKTRGIAVWVYDNLFVVVVAVVVMLSIRIVGLLMINAMLILPAAASRNVARSMRSYHVLALIFGLFSGVLGLLLSFYNAVVGGPMIVLCAAMVFFGTLFLARKK